MEMSKEEYFFYEWMIIHKGITEDHYKLLTEDEIMKLKVEFYLFYRGL